MALTPEMLIALATGMAGGGLLVLLILQRRLARQSFLEQQLEQARRECTRHSERILSLEKERADLAARLEEQQRHHAERLAELERARNLLKAEFEGLASRILEEKAQTFHDHSRRGLDELLTPVREQLRDFRQRIDQIHSTEQHQHGTLLNELRRLQEASQRLDQEARDLTLALKGDSKARGTWGEIVLETVLERSGLRKGQEYRVQGSFRDGDGRLLRPDVVVHLPEGKHVIIDSKVSLTAWQDYVGAADEASRKAALGHHLESVRRHLDNLSGKNYEDLRGVNSLDFVLMFMPIEAAFSAAFQADPELFARAFDQHIVVVTPTTLLATLRTIENLWRFERQQENVRHIVDRAARLYDKLRGFLEDFERIGQQLDTTRLSYERARKRLSDGQGNLIRQAEAFVELGVKVKKRLPHGLSAAAGRDASDADGE